MKTKTKPDIFSEDVFYDVHFKSLELDNAEIQHKTFEHCQFNACHFNEALFINCKFIDCEFNACNLNAAQFTYSSFTDTVFNESKLSGINWTKAKWPLIKLTSPIKFYKSNISLSSFFELELKEIVIEECKAHDVDFRGGNFSDGRFMLTDFENSLFLHTNLQSTDFTDALNYNISPNDNNIKKAKFSMPDATNLLHHFDIEIDGL